jgi:hypothetical protein
MALGGGRPQLGVSLGATLWQHSVGEWISSNKLSPTLALRWSPQFITKADVLAEISEEPLFGSQDNSHQWIGAIGVRPHTLNWGAGELWVRGGLGDTPFVMIALKLSVTKKLRRKAIKVPQHF